MELRECPFCGGTDVSVAEGSTFRWVVAICNNCDASAPESRVIPNDEEKTRELALVEWNRRASPARVPEGYAIVPVEILDRFPEINPSNYDHDNACALNAWGVELVLAAAPTPPSTEDRWQPIETNEAKK